MYHEIDPGLVMPKQQQLVLNWLNDNTTANNLTKLQLPVLILNGEADVVYPAG